jgi:hypothetical protein
MRACSLRSPLRLAYGQPKSEEEAAVAAQHENRLTFTQHAHSLPEKYPQYLDSKHVRWLYCKLLRLTFCEMICFTAAHSPPARREVRP